jgi:hypothetical protein
MLTNHSAQLSRSLWGKRAQGCSRWQALPSHQHGSWVFLSTATLRTPLVPRACRTGQLGWAKCALGLSGCFGWLSRPQQAARTPGCQVTEALCWPEMAEAVWEGDPCLPLSNDCSHLSQKYMSRVRAGAVSCENVTLTGRAFSDQPGRAEAFLLFALCNARDRRPTSRVWRPCRGGSGEKRALGTVQILEGVAET